MKWITLIAAILIGGCAKHEAQEPVGSLLVDLKQKRDIYMDLVAFQDDGDGMVHDDIEHQTGDSLFFTCLHGVGGGIVVPENARDGDDRWWRHYSRVGSFDPSTERSSISRDPLLACSLYWFLTEDLDALQRLAEYDRANSGVMGQHDGSLTGNNRVTMTPGLRGLIHKAIRKLGEDPPDGLTAPQVWLPCEGFECHLMAVRALFVGLMDGSVNQVVLNTLGSLTKKDPNNALFHAILSRFTDGDQDTAARILLRDDLFPIDRLPDTSDRCVPYLWNHGEKPKDWQPCPEEQLVHEGTDFLFASAIALGDLP